MKLFLSSLLVAVCTASPVPQYNAANAIGTLIGEATGGLIAAPWNAAAGLVGGFTQGVAEGLFGRPARPPPGPPPRGYAPPPPRGYAPPPPRGYGPQYGRGWNVDVTESTETTEATEAPEVPEVPVDTVEPAPEAAPQNE